MRYYFFTIIALILILLTSCGIKPVPLDNRVSYVASAHVEGDDVYFEYNGKYYVAKNQRTNFENTQGELMTVIQMSDGSFIIQQNDKNVSYQNGYDPKANKQAEEERKQKQEQERQAKLAREQQLEDERIAYLRSKELNKQKLDQQKLDLKAEAQETHLQNATDYVKAQIGKVQAETQKVLNQIN